MNDYQSIILIVHEKNSVVAFKLTHLASLTIENNPIL